MESRRGGETPRPQERMRLSESEQVDMAREFLAIADAIGDEVLPEVLDKIVARHRVDLGGYRSEISAPIQRHVYDSLCEMFEIGDAARSNALVSPVNSSEPVRPGSLRAILLKPNRRRVE